MVRSTAKSTYFKELLFPFFKIFYTLIVHYVINFVFSIGKQPYKDVVSFVSYIHVVYIYNARNFTYLYMRTNYLRHLANIVDILWSRPVFFWGGGPNSQLNWLTCYTIANLISLLKYQNQTISNFYIYHKYMTYHIYYSIF